MGLRVVWCMCVFVCVCICVCDGSVCCSICSVCVAYLCLCGGVCWYGVSVRVVCGVVYMCMYVCGLGGMSECVCDGSVCVVYVWYTCL